MVGIAPLVLRGLLMGAVLAYALAYASACLFLRDLARHIGDRRLPVIAVASATAVLPLGVLVAVGIRWFVTRPPEVWPFGDFGFGPAELADRAVLGFAAVHVIFWLLCRRSIRLVNTELEFTPDTDAISPTATSPGPVAPRQSSAPTVPLPHTE
jgi:hypothetical protein